MADNPIPRCEFESQNLILNFRTSIPADVQRIGPIVEHVMGLVRRMGCAAGHEFEVETALREALANAIIHGAGGDPHKKVEFCVSCDDSRRMLIVVRDPGPGFDPASISSPVVGQRIYSTHGRGIYLINQLMDEVRFERGGTEIHMVKR